MGVTMAEPAVWTEVAIANAVSNPAFANPDQRETLKKWLGSTENILSRYRSSDGIGLNSFPHQVDSNSSAIYPTTMELVALLDARTAGPLFTDTATDDRIRQLSDWLVQQFDFKQRGWPATRSGGIVDSLKFQVYSALLRAEREVGFVIPKQILDAIPHALQDASERNYQFPPDELTYTNEFENQAGARAKTNELIVILWHPWAVQTALFWLQRSQTPEHVSAYDAAIAQRALDHLVIDMAPDIKKRATQTYTYEIAETLYLLSIL